MFLILTTAPSARLFILAFQGLCRRQGTGKTSCFLIGQGFRNGENNFFLPFAQPSTFMHTNEKINHKETPSVNTASEQAAKPHVKQAPKRLKSAQKASEKTGRVVYRPEFCQRLLAFFDIPPFKVTEVQKKDGSISFVESASELPTFAAFARTLGVTQSILQNWEEAHPAFAEAAKKARDLQGDILIQNSLRGNYSASFAVFTAKNLLGWTDGKDEAKKPLGTVIVHWEKE